MRHSNQHKQQAFECSGFSLLTHLSPSPVWETAHYLSFAWSTIRPLPRRYTANELSSVQLCR